MNTFNKFILAASLLTVLAAPLAACSRTWDGLKEDWHNVTGDDGREPAAPPAPAATVTKEPPASYQVEAPKPDNGPMRLNP